MIIKCNENYMDMEFDFLYESMTSFNDIFEEIGLNESSLVVITEASVHEIIEKIKAFFKKLFEKFVDVFKNAFDIYKQRVFMFNRFYEANELILLGVVKGIINDQIPTEKVEKEAFDLYSFFSLDHHLGFNWFDKIEFNINPVDQNTLLLYASGNIDDEDLDNLLNKYYNSSLYSSMRLLFTNDQLIRADGSKTSIRAFIDDNKGFEGFKENKQSFLKMLASPHMEINKKNIGNVWNNINAIYRNMGRFNSQYDKCRKEAKNAYDEVIKKLNELEEYVLKNAGEAGIKITTGVKKYSEHYKKCLNTIYDIMAIGLQARAGQIKSYFAIMRYLMRFVKYAPKGLISSSKPKTESSMFESVQFI